MRIGVALFALLISISVMLLIARKWNISNPSTLLGAITIALLSSIPFLWVYDFLAQGWLLIIGVVGQVGLSGIIALILVFYHFWRDPERLSPQEKGVIVSPADGEVIYVKLIPNGSTPLVTKNGRDYCLHELVGTELPDHGMLAVGIEMNILNVHVNRCPVEGDVRLVKHISGGFSSLRNKEAPFINARCTTLIRNQVLTVAIVQIASRLVRRVDNYLHLGQTVALGQRLGMIRFGSQVAIILPQREHVSIEVQIGDVVVAGTSILARYSPDNPDIQW